jgi:hypothetical protein
MLFRVVVTREEAGRLAQRCGETIPPGSSRPLPPESKDKGESDGRPEAPILIIGNEATAGGKTYPLDDCQAAFIRALTEAGPGVWVAGREMGVRAQPHPERIFAKLPEAIRAKIESKRGAGYRLRPSKLV